MIIEAHCHTNYSLTNPVHCIDEVVEQIGVRR